MRVSRDRLHGRRGKAVRLDTANKRGPVTRIKKSTSRVVASGSRRDDLHDLVVTLYPDGTVEMRPKGARSESAKVSASWALLYQWALAARAREVRRSLII